jgi:hypothetical protein
MSEKTLYEEKWKSKGFNGKLRLIEIHGTNTHKQGDIAIKQSISPENTKYGDVVIFTSYLFLSRWIRELAKEHGKSEVERELGIKIV